MRASKIIPCVDCCEEYPRKELNRNGRCPGCAMAAVRDVTTQMHQKAGPYYDRWKQGLKTAAQKL